MELSSSVLAMGLDQQELIRRILDGERSLFHELVRPYEKLVYVMVHSMLRNEADAEDATQDAFLKALQNLHQLQDPARFKSWLVQIARNEARLKMRSQRGLVVESMEEGERPTEDGESPMPRDFADWREIPSETLERKEIRFAIDRSLEEIPAIYRDALVLRDIEQLEIDEAAAILKISENALKVRVHRARLMMREKLAPAFRRNWLERLLAGRGTK